MLFRIDTTTRSATAIRNESFAGLKVLERHDIQEWVLNNPEVLGEELFVVTTEFDSFDRTSERLDVLALDSQGRLVVVELKRTASGTAAELQAIRYAAYCSTLALSDVAELHAEYLKKRHGVERSAEEAERALLDFVTDPGFEELDDKPRIILAAEEFPQEITATILWLRSFEVDISAVRLRPYSVDGTLLVDSTVLIPLPEAEEFLVRRERKDVTRTTRSRIKGEAYRAFFQALIDEMREKHDYTSARAGQPQPWYLFASGVSGVKYGASFSRQGFRAEIYIDTGDKAENKRLFDAIYALRDEIGQALGEDISWERLDDRRASRIAVYHGEATIEDSDEDLDAARRWLVGQLLRFSEVFTSRFEKAAR